MSQQPDFTDAYRPPQTATYVQPVSIETGDSTGGIIPYKNPCALVAYYLGLFSLFPLLGLFLAVPAFVLGIMGLRARRRNPVIKGSVHAWIGIIMGGMMTIVWGGMAVMLLIVLAFAPRH